MLKNFNGFVDYLLLSSLPVSEPIMVMMSCGPYTPSDSLSYDPLIDLITIINKDRPDVCILVGTAYDFLNMMF